MTGMLWFPALLKDSASAGVKEGVLLNMMNDEGLFRGTRRLWV